MLAIGLSEQRVWLLIRKTGWDSVPAVRTAVLSILVEKDGPATRSDLEERSGLPRKTVERVAEDLAVLGLIERSKNDAGHWRYDLSEIARQYWQNDPQPDTPEQPANGAAEPKTGTWPEMSDPPRITREKEARIEVADELAAAFEGQDQTIAIGRGAPVEAHRLPPDATGEQRSQLRRFLADAARRQAVLAIDCETTGVDPYGLDVRVWSVSDGAQAWAIDARDAASTGQLAADLARFPGPITAHNITFDLPVAIRTLGLDADSFTRRARAGALIDTMILARLAHPDERRIGLKEIARLELGDGAPDPEQRLKLAFRHLKGHADEKWRHVDPAHPAYWAYAASDAAITARLHDRLRAGLDDEFVAREMRVAMICLRAGLRGWRVDPDAAQELQRDLAAEQDQLEKRLRRVGITSVTTAAGRAAITDALRREGHTLDGTSLAKGALDPVALAGSQVARDVLALRTATKFNSLFVPLFTGAGERDGRLHAFPLTLATVTGRMSLPGVPLQTAPKGELELGGGDGSITAAVRSALVAEEGNVTAGVDFSTMELRIAAALSGDARLRQAVEQGDAHVAVAKRLFDTARPTAKQRAAAKTVNFGVLYGMGGDGLARRLKITDDQARAFVDRWWQAFPAVRKLRERLAREERVSLWGRRLPADDVPPHIALNHVIQGYGRDIFAAGLLALDDAGADAHLLLPLHDEYVLQLDRATAADDAEEIARLVQSRLREVELPVETSIGSRSWASVGTA
jgi:DNA polymerase-1